MKTVSEPKITGYLMEDVLLYSKCPMLLFFKKYLGMSSKHHSIQGQVSETISSSLSLYLSNIESSNAYSLASRNLGIETNNITVDPSVRGSPKKQKILKDLIDNCYVILERCVDELKNMEISNVVSPYTYAITLGRATSKYDDFIGEIDCVYTRYNKKYLMYFDTNINSPSEDYLDNGITATINSLAYRMSECTNDYKIVHYWINGNSIFEIDRKVGQLNSVKNEIINIKESMVNCMNNNLWYRSKGFWCASCPRNVPCSEMTSI
jgi:hypothetical protein